MIENGYQPSMAPGVEQAQKTQVFHTVTEESNERAELMRYICTGLHQEIPALEAHVSFSQINPATQQEVSPAYKMVDRTGNGWIFFDQFMSKITQKTKEYYHDPNVSRNDAIQIAIAETAAALKQQYGDGPAIAKAAEQLMKQAIVQDAYNANLDQITAQEKGFRREKSDLIFDKNTGEHAKSFSGRVERVRGAVTSIKEGVQMVAGPVVDAARYGLQDAAQTLHVKARALASSSKTIQTLAGLNNKI